jgi:hypothetical protein
MDWEEQKLLYGQEVEIMIPEDLYRDVVGLMDRENLLKHYERCLNQDKFENLIVLREECEKRRIKIEITGDVNLTKGKYSLVNEDENIPA